MKYNILMVPSWYPTNENPILGSFFREQALALTENFNFYVAHISYSYCSILRFLFRKFIKNELFRISISKVDENLPQISINGYICNINKAMLLFLKIFHINYQNIILTQKYRTYTNLVKLLDNSLNFKIDLVYAMTAQVNGEEVFTFAQNHNLPIILAEHCPFPLPGTVINPGLKYAIEKSDAVFSTSNHVTRMILMQNIKCNPVNVGNMIDDSVFTIKEVPDSSVFTIITVAAYNYYKDYETFLKSISHLKEITNSNFHVIIVGIQPTNEQNDYVLGLNKFNNIFKNYDLQSFTTVISKASREEMVKLYQQSNVYLSTSIQETFGVSCVEAMACGLPVIATKSGGVEDFIDNTCGALFDIQDYKSISQMLKKIIEGDIVFDKQSIRNRIIAKYGKSIFINRITNNFNNIIQGRKDKEN